MDSDIINEIELYLSKYRKNSFKLQLKHIENIDDALDSGAPGYNKSWCKLGLSEKLNRLMKYHNKVIIKTNMENVKADAMRKYFYDNVNSILASDEFVTYDQAEGDIVTILGLKYDGIGFYIDDPASKPKEEGIRIKHTPIFNLDQLQMQTKSQSQHQSQPQPQLQAQPQHQIQFQPHKDEKTTDLPVKKAIIIKKKL